MIVIGADKVARALDHSGCIALMREAIRACESHFPGEPIALSAQSHLERFYASLGFEPTSPEYVEDGIPHIDMQRPVVSETER